jgi:hypothetical protein
MSNPRRKFLKSAGLGVLGASLLSQRFAVHAAESNIINSTTSQTVSPPQGGLFYRVTGEGTNRQTLTITNRSGENIATKWSLQFDFSGTAPNIEWPADWTSPSGGRINTTVNGALNNNGSVPVPMNVGLNTRISNVMVNGILAVRE